MAEGRCLCGAVRYRVAAFQGPVYACHCRQCRKQSGHVAAAAPVRCEDLAIEGAPRWFAASDTARRGFCPTCGSTLFWQQDDGLVWVTAGTLDGATGLRLAANIYYADKGDYYRASGRLPCYERWTTSPEIAP